MTEANQSKAEPHKPREPTNTKWGKRQQQGSTPTSTLISGWLIFKLRDVERRAQTYISSAHVCRGRRHTNTQGSRKRAFACVHTPQTDPRHTQPAATYTECHKVYQGTIEEEVDHQSRATQRHCCHRPRYPECHQCGTRSICQGHHLQSKNRTPCFLGVTNIALRTCMRCLENGDLWKDDDK